MKEGKIYTVYIIESESGRRYIGISDDVNKRLTQHNSGLSKWASRYKNWKIIYRRTESSLSEARKYENYLKRLKGGNGLKQIIKVGQVGP